MKRAKGQNYIYGAVILTAGVAIMKLLGFIYKVPIGNILGDDGYSMFISAYNVYNVFYILTTAGFPVALARMISTATANNRPMQVRRIFSVASATLFVIGLVGSLLMFFGNELLAVRFLHNPDAALSIRAMSPSVLLVCMLSSHRGYCEGHGNMLPTTVGQVIEVAVKVVFGVVLALLVLRMGGSKAMASAGAIAGAAAGSLIALIYMFIYKLLRYRPEPMEEPDVPDSRRDVLKEFIRIGIPIAFGSCVMAFLNLVDSSLCQGRLQSAAGFSLEQAETLYGVYGKAQTLFNLPAAFVTPLTISVVPAISSALARGEHDEATKVTEDSLRIASVLCVPMGLGLAVMSYPIMRLIYPSSHESGPALLCVMGIAAVFVCLVLMENAILQSTGHERLPMITLIVGGVIKVAVNWFLVGDPEIHIYGAPVGTLVSYVVMAILNYVFMCRVLDRRPRLSRFLLRPMFCGALMCAASYGVYYPLSLLLGVGTKLGLVICGVMGILAAMLVYVLCTVAFRAITKEDMELIPGGARIAAILRLR